MANPGKVFHLDMEVKFLDDEEGKELKNVEVTHYLKAHGQDVFPQSQNGALNMPHDLATSVKDQHQVGQDKEVETHQHEHNLLHDGIQHLVFELQPDLKGGTDNWTQTHLIESEPICHNDSRNSGHFTAPSTPSGVRKTYGQMSEGKRSTVTYSYIEKASIRSVSDNNIILCRNEPENLFINTFHNQTPFHKTEIFPVGFQRQEMICNSNVKNTLTDPVNNSWDTSKLQFTTLNSIARNAAHHRSKEIGFPQLRHQLANANHPGKSYNTLHREQPPCHSWSGSPVVPCVAKTLPVNAHPLDLNYHSHLHGIKNSQAAHNLSSDAQQPYTLFFSNNGQSQASLSQQVWNNDGTLKQGYRDSSISPFSRPSNIYHQISNNTFAEPTHNYTLGQKTSENPRQVNKANFCINCLSEQPSFNNSKLSASGSVSCVEMNHNVVEEATKLSKPLEYGKSSFPTQSQSEALNPDSNFRTSTCIIQEPQQEREVNAGNNNPLSCQHQLPHYRENNNYNGAYIYYGLRESPDLMTPCRKFNNNIPVVSTSKHHCREPNFSSSMSNTNKNSEDAEELLVMDKESPNVLSSEETHLIVPEQQKKLTCVEQNNALSQSFSGVTGSPVEVIQPERDSVSPVACYQNSQKSRSAENTAIQLNSGSSLFDPSLHCQRIARAKWEFLFGKPLEDSHRVTVPVAFVDHSNYSTASNSCDQPISNIQNTSNHNIQHLDMEPDNPPLPSALDPSTKAGIIRHTIKYLETDLDAVPLHCYRETDIDEVIPAKQEKIDIGITSNHNVMATSGISSGKLFCLQSSEKEEQLHDDEMVSWASVRRHCVKKRQQAVQDGDKVFSCLLKGSENCQSDSSTAIMSPMAVESPSRISTDGFDSFSRHFESVIESQRAKGTSYSSLDSEDMGFSGPSIFTFDFTTLTPEIQSQICESAKQILDLSFSPLRQPEASNVLSPSTSETLAGAEQAISVEGNELTSVPAENHISSESTKAMTQSERASGFILQSDHVAAQRLALGKNYNTPIGCMADLQTAKLLAKRLYNLDGFRRSDIAKHLGKNNNFSRMVAEEYLSYFNFSGMSIDQALRVFLREFALIGETQERERVLSHFSRRYLQCNPNAIPNLDSIHTLTCALMLLNTDLHGHNVGKKMSCMQFIRNLEGLNGGQNFPKDLLKALYNSIKNEKLQWTIDEEDVRKSVSELADSRKDSASHTLKRITSGGASLVSLAQQSNAQVYKKGFLVRKVHADPDGKRTPRGRRGWKTFYAILKGLVLYLQKSEYGAPKQLSHEDLKNAVSIHHSLAMKAADYSKRPNVFYLRTADWRVFLFQAPNAEQMQSWITRINTVAAMFSAPPFPAAIGSQKKFIRPLLPGSNTKLSQEEQVKSHEMRFRSVSSELHELRSIPQKPKGKENEETKQREEYLEFEKTRYGTYAMLLRAKIRTGESDLTAFEACLFSAGPLQHTVSSPTLAHDTSHASASSCSSRSKKSSRSESQRHKPAVKQ